MAYAYVQDNAEINFALGNLWYEQAQRRDRAIFFYKRTVDLDPTARQRMEQSRCRRPRAEKLSAGGALFPSSRSNSRRTTPRRTSCSRAVTWNVATTRSRGRGSGRRAPARQPSFISPARTLKETAIATRRWQRPDGGGPQPEQPEFQAVTARSWKPCQDSLTGGRARILREGVVPMSIHTTRRTRRRDRAAATRAARRPPAPAPAFLGRRHPHRRARRDRAHLSVERAMPRWRLRRIALSRLRADDRAVRRLGHYPSICAYYLRDQAEPNASDQAASHALPLYLQRLSCPPGRLRRACQSARPPPRTCHPIPFASPCTASPPRPRFSPSSSLASPRRA